MNYNSMLPNVTSSYYLYEAYDDKNIVKGILYRISATLKDLDTLIPHESVDESRVAQTISAMLSGELNRLPIAVGVQDPGFLDLINFVTTNVKIKKDKQIISAGKLGSLKHEQISHKILRLQNLILIDGHHRSAAARKVLENGENIDLWFWLVPFYTLNTNSFVRAFRNTFNISIDKLVTEKYRELEFLPSPNVLNNFEICLHYNKRYYHCLFESEEEFLHELNNVKNKLEQFKFTFSAREETINRERMGLNVISHEANTLILEHSPITHDMVLNVISRNNTLPLHSTCFKPKPVQVPLTLHSTRFKPNTDQTRPTLISRNKILMNAERT